MAVFLRWTYLVVMAAASVSTARAAGPDHWVGTWATAPVMVVNPKGGVGTEDETLREVVRVSLGGAMMRVVLTNEFGTGPLTIGAVHVALRVNGSEVKLASANALTFGGQTSVTIPAGAKVVSDPAALKVPALADLAISIFVPKQAIAQITQHTGAWQTNYVVPGDHVGDKVLDGAKDVTAWRFLKGVDVLASAQSGAIVALGDSITDGTQSTRDANARWPDVLAARLQGNKKTAMLGVLNLGISGNRLLHDITGPGALMRFDRDVLGQSGVKYLVVLEGINDIGKTAKPLKADDPVTTEQLLFALGQLIEMAHAHGIKVIGATLLPYSGAEYASAEGEAMRQAENAFIRSGKFDGVIDFDKAMSDAGMMRPAEDSGDHLHPNDAGYKAMGEAVDLRLFGK